MRGIVPLASGSKGNAIYVGASTTKLLFDAGLSARAITKRLEEIDVSITEIDAIVISHEHSDHIRGVEILAAKYNIPIFANAETAKAIASLVKKKPKFKIFSTGETFEHGDFEIHPFSIQHDTVEPVGFTVQMGNVKVGICTDLGFVTSLVKARLKDCDYLVIESNHEPSMVHSCPRPMVYKQRVLGRQGHLSNDACAELLAELQHPNLRRVYLAHLSQECNNPELALKKAKEALTLGAEVFIAYQEKVSVPTELVLDREYEAVERK